MILLDERRMRLDELEKLEQEYEKLAEELEHYRQQYLYWNKMLDYNLELACSQIALYDTLSHQTKQKLLDVQQKIVEHRKNQPRNKTMPLWTRFNRILAPVKNFF